jgi:hypothetical protein
MLALLFLITSASAIDGPFERCNHLGFDSERVLPLPWRINGSGILKRTHWFASIHSFAEGWKTRMISAPSIPTSTNT